jgi:hypothetical protein
MATTETLVKLNRILDGLMGVKLGLQFQAADELSIDQWKSGDLQILKEKSELAPQYIQDGTGTTLGFPINLQGNFAGLAVVNNWNGARPKQLMLLAELVTSMLERGLAEEDRREKLKTLEERMLLETDKPKNVIALRPANGTRFTRRAVETIATHIASAFDRNKARFSAPPHRC